MRLDCDDDEVLPPQEERSPIAAAKCSAIAVAAYILIVVQATFMFADSAFIGAHVFFDRRSKKNH